MKTYTQLIMEAKGVIPLPIHFKHMIAKLVKQIPAPINFKHTKPVKPKKEIKESIDSPEPEHDDKDFTKEWLNKDDNNRVPNKGKNKQVVHKIIRKNDKYETIHTTPKFKKGTDKHRDLSASMNKDDHELSYGEKSTIRHYCGNGSMSINHILLGNHNIGSERDHKEQKIHTKRLDSVIKKSPINRDLHCYSGTSFDPREHLDQHGHMHSPAYISATHRKDKAYAFTSGKHDPVKNRNVRHIIHFHLKKGDPAHHIGEKSHLHSEHETIIARDTKLKYHGTMTYTNGRSDHPNLVHVHHMSIVREKKKK